MLAMTCKIDFDVQFSNLFAVNFINCFASVYTYLEGECDGRVRLCPPDFTEERKCFGCGGCDDPDPQALNYCFFDTICGRSALHLRFDGVPTEMAKLIGDGNGAGGWNGKCGTEYTADFLFGLTGYEYRKVTDANKFYNEITSSIEAGKPVIAECETENSPYRIITGYDGDALINAYRLNGQQLKDPPMPSPSYGELKTLYIVGDKTAPRYTLKDGFERVKRVMENNFEEKIWDRGVEEITATFLSPTDDEYRNINPDVLNDLKNRIARTITNQFNSHTLDIGLLRSRFKGMRDPALLKLWDEADRCQGRLGDYAHSAWRFNSVDMSGVGPFRIGIGKMYITAIEDIKNVHMKMLEIIEQAIAG
jgi:hypothetical protein